MCGSVEMYENFEGKHALSYVNLDEFVVHCRLQRK